VVIFPLSVDAFGLLMEKVLSWLNDFKSYVGSQFSTISSAQAELVTVSAELAAARGKLDEAASKILALEFESAQRAQAINAKDAEISNLTSSLAEARKAAEDTLAAQGLSQDRIPAGSTTSGSQTVAQQLDGLRKKLSATTDPKEKFTLSKQISELRFQKN
jgi:CelD/BcsL family acetyltransferase involved in cellulose biosynthesis